MRMWQKSIIACSNHFCIIVYNYIFSHLFSMVIYYAVCFFHIVNKLFLNMCIFFQTLQELYKYPKSMKIYSFEFSRFLNQVSYLFGWKKGITVVKSGSQSSESVTFLIYFLKRFQCCKNHQNPTTIGQLADQKKFRRLFH